MEEKKVSPEKLAELLAAQQEFKDTVLRLGELHVQRKKIKESIREIETFLDELGLKGQQMAQELETFFGGPGNIDLDTGEFTPLK